LARGEAGLAELDPGGLEVFSMTKEDSRRLCVPKTTPLKRALTDPEWFSGIGNAYSDEILWQAKLSPLAQTLKLKDEEIARLFEATRESLTAWTERLRAEMGEKFPEGDGVSAGDGGTWEIQQDCPRCGGKVQRIKYASNETNYCQRARQAGNCWRTGLFEVVAGRLAEDAGGIGDEDGKSEEF